MLKATELCFECGDENIVKGREGCSIGGGERRCTIICVKMSKGEGGDDKKSEYNE